MNKYFFKEKRMGINKSAVGRIATYDNHRSKSNWHWDPMSDPNEVTFNTLCTFKGDWSKAIDDAIDNCSEIEAKVRPELIGKVTADDHEELDIIVAAGKESISLNYWKELYFVNSYDEHGNITDVTKEENPIYEPFFKMSAALGYFEPHTMRVTFQRMGQMSPYHIDINHQYFKGDNFTKRYMQVAGEDHLRLRRVFIALAPYHFGQIWQFGNSFWQNYQPGEAVTFDWKNMPHGTANMGFFPRVNLQITGFVDDKFDWLLKNGSKDYIIDLDKVS